MLKFKLRYCKARMVAYLNGELSPGARRRVARYIDECPDCYAEYVRQRELQQELTHRLATFGQPRPVQLNRIWAAVQEEMQASQPSRSNSKHYLRYSVVLLALLLVMFLPLTLLGNEVASSVMVTQPTPDSGNHVIVDNQIPAQATLVAAATLPVDETNEVNTIMPEAAPQHIPQRTSQPVE